MHCVLSDISKVDLVGRLRETVGRICFREWIINVTDATRRDILYQDFYNFKYFAFASLWITDTPPIKMFPYPHSVIMYPQEHNVSPLSQLVMTPQKIFPN